ncbi:MAG TPA: hypothetical protein VJ835_11660 [Fimbriimonadaceae bacterium]|nr:hypothetical protein [Fimbriimonadaceae bacterium]
MADQELIARTTRLANTCLQSFEGKQIQAVPSNFSIVVQDDFFEGCRKVRFGMNSVTIDSHTGYIPYAHFRVSSVEDNLSAEIPTREQIQARITSICKSAGMKSDIRVTDVSREKSLTIHFSPVWSGLRYSNFHASEIVFDMTGAVRDLYLGWYPAPPARMPQINFTKNDCLWLAVQKLAGRGDYVARTEARPTELVISCEDQSESAEFYNRPAVPRPLSDPAVRPDILSRVVYHVILRVDASESSRVDHFMFDPSNGSSVWSSTPKLGAPDPPISAIRAWIPPSTGIFRIASKSGKAWGNLSKNLKRTVAQKHIVPNCLVLIGNRALSGQWLPKEKRTLVESAGSIYSLVTR